MSSSNLVRLAFIEESTYGVTPGSGNFSTARFTSESLSGSPNTVASKQIRTDRMSSGQVVVGLGVQGAMQFELAKEGAIDLLISSAMHSTWATSSLKTVNFDIDASAKTLTRASGSFITDGVVVGDILTLGAFVNAGNNVQVMAVNVTALVVTYSGPSGMVTEVGSGSTTFKVSDKIGIGTTKKSFSMEKKFLDLTTKGVNYKGMIASQMDLNIAFGSLITGSFNFMGNYHETVSTAGAFITNTRTVDSPATTNTLNGSVDMPFIASSAVGVLSQSAFDMKSIAIKMNNNLSPQDVIGNTAPKDYSSGEASIDITLEAYLTDAVWAVLGKKLTQEPFAIGFVVKNSGGYYGFYLPQVQVSFDDPASAGANQFIMLSMKGVSKVGATGESALTIYRG